MELRHLRYFVAVAEAGNLTDAAARARVAKQALSVQIRDVERELGVPLFVRSTQGMSPTPAGREFLAYAREALVAHERAVARMRRLAARHAPLRLARTHLWPVDALLERAVRRLREARPALALTFLAPGVGQQAEAVREHRLDAALHLGHADDLAHGAAGGRTSVRPGLELTAVLLLDLAIDGVLLPRAHPLARRPAVEPGELGRLTQIALPSAQHPVAFAEKLRRLQAHGWRPRAATIEVEPRDVDRRLWSGASLWAGVSRLFAVDAPAPLAYRPLAGGTGSPWALHLLVRPGDDDPVEGDERIVHLLAALREEVAALALDAPDRRAG